MPDTRAAGKPFHGMPADLTLPTGNAALHSTVNTQDSSGQDFSGGYCYFVVLCLPVSFKGTETWEQWYCCLGGSKAVNLWEPHSQGRKSHSPEPPLLMLAFPYPPSCQCPPVQSQIPHASRGRNEKYEEEKYNSHFEYKTRWAWKTGGALCQATVTSGPERTYYALF